jgi:uncharacterized membrane protein
MLKLLSKKMFMLLGFVALFATNSFSATTTGTANTTITNIGDSGAFIAGATGISLVHALFWLPIVFFLVGASLIIGFYYKQFKQKDDGLMKTIFAFILGLIVGAVLYVLTLKVIDTIFDSADCGSDIATAYLKDSVGKGLSPSTYTFGTKIKAVGCLSST